MRWTALNIAALLLGLSLFARDNQSTSSPPNQFEVGRHTFWDIGPPFDYYDLFMVRPSGEGATVERVILTPPAGECFAPGKIEVASAHMNESPAELLGSFNACAIPESELKRKPKGCKHCQRYSGADVAMKVQCGTKARIIPSHIFEDYWFDSSAKVPKNAVTILQLLKQLDDAVGPGVMERPIFDFSDHSSAPAKPLNSDLLEQLAAGDFDELFSSAPDKLSGIYRAARQVPPPPTVQLVVIAPYTPSAFALPEYPPLARAARIEGRVTFTENLDADGSPTLVTATGHPLLQPAVRKRFTRGNFQRKLPTNRSTERSSSF